MATYTGTAYAVPTVSAAGNTGYALAMKDIRDALVACGFTQTSDTGQLDLTGGTAPALVYNAGNWVYSQPIIMAFNDSLQATKPVFMRIEFAGNQSNSPPALSGLRIQFGSGTNGASVLTGAAVTAPAHLPMTPGNGYHLPTSLLTLCSGNGSEFSLAWRNGATQGTTSESMILQVERTRNASGAYDGFGVLYEATPAGYGQCTTGIFPTDGSTPPAQPNAYFYYGAPLMTGRPARTTALVGNDYTLFPYGGWVHEGQFRQSAVRYCIPTADMVVGNIFTATIFGQTRTLRNMGTNYTIGLNGNNYPASQARAISNSSGYNLGLSMCMRWD